MNEEKEKKNKEALLKALKILKREGKLAEACRTKTDGQYQYVTKLRELNIHGKEYSQLARLLGSIGYSSYESVQTFVYEHYVCKTEDGYKGGWWEHYEDEHGYEQYDYGETTVTDREFEQYYYTIDIEKLGAEIGMEAKEQKLPNGKVVKSLIWDQENLLKATKAVKHLSEEGKPVRITGPAPAWLVSALTHTVHPCPVSVYMPQIGKDVDIPQLTHGEANLEGEVAFKITEKGDAVLIEYNMDLPEGITTYDENNLSKVVVPEIAQGKAVYISGKGPNYLTVAIAEAYAHTNSSVSLFQPGVGYTCSITHSRAKNLGDLTKDPLVKEEVKEQLVASKENLAQEQSQDKEVEPKEGPAID